MNTSPTGPARARALRSLLTRKNAWITAAVLSAAAIGITGCSATSQAATSTPTSSSTSAPAKAGHGFPAEGGSGGGSNARSGPAEGGSSGTVTSVTSSGFTLTTVAGQKVTVKESSATTYENGTSSATVSVVAKGATVLVLGMTDSTTITASQVTVQPPASGGSPSYTPSAVVPFTQGSPSKANKDGKVPTDYTEGSGTIVTGTAADKAAEVALATYPGGVVDRVVKLSDGEYEVHYIGVNWPHHVFVTTSDTVVGAY
jgi:membrane-bound inhibitor of C-type lysozyme